MLLDRELSACWTIHVQTTLLDLQSMANTCNATVALYLVMAAGHGHAPIV